MLLVNIICAVSFGVEMNKIQCLPFKNRKFYLDIQHRVTCVINPVKLDKNK